jgi:hypothetical protein
MSSYPDSDLFDENPLDILSETLEDEIKDDLDEVSLLEATVPQRRMVLPVSEDAGSQKIPVAPPPSDRLPTLLFLLGEPKALRSGK